MDPDTKTLHINSIRHVRGMAQVWENWVRAQPNTPGENRLQGVPLMLFMQRALISAWDEWIKGQDHKIR